MIDEDAIAQSVPLAGISAGGDESQPLDITATSDNPGLIPNPAVEYTSPDSTATLTYTPVSDQHGTAVITVTVTDGGFDGDLLTAADNGSFSQDFTVTVNPVNDPPSLDPIADEVIDEDAPQQIVSLAGIASGGGQTQPLTITATSNNPALIPDPTVAYTSPDATGSLNYTPLADQFGAAVITVKVTDPGLDNDVATTVDNSFVEQTFTVTVNAVNDAPTIEDIQSQTIDEDGDFGPLEFSIGDVDDNVNTLTLSATSSDQSLVANDSFSFGGTGASPTIAFTPVADAFGAVTITITVEDDEGAASHDQFNLTINALNDAPTSVGGVVHVDENIDYAFILGDFNFSDVDPSDSLSQVRVDSLPLLGQLLLNGATVAAGDVVPAVQIANGELSFLPAPGTSGDNYASFAFSVHDGLVYSTSPAAMTINVTPANAVPTTQDAAITIDEDQVYAFQAADFPFADADLGQTLAAVSDRCDSSAGPAVVQRCAGQCRRQHHDS